MPGSPPWFLIACCFSALAGRLAGQEALSLRKAEAAVQEARRRWEPPGLAVALVTRDRVLLVKGYGVLEAGKDRAITPDTLFPLASCTKPFTTTLLALLVDEGTLRWDDPVRKHLPWFRLADPSADRDAVLRDLLCHRTGVGRHDNLWYRAPWSLEVRIRKIGLVQPERSFRSGFGYQTILFGAAGLAGAKAADTSWEEALRKRVLNPLGMQNSHPSFPTNPPEDSALPHRRDRSGKITVVARYPLEQADPAGSLHSTARDLARFLRLQLNEGKWQGKRLVAAETLGETHAPQVILPLDVFARIMNPETLHLHYGLGWIEQDYRGKRMLQHGGAIDGFRTHLTLVPEAGFGLALLSNLDGGFMNLALSNTLVDLVLEAPARDWMEHYQQVERTEAADKRRAEQAFLAGRDPKARPTLAEAAYVGSYQDPAYGSCTVEQEETGLVWKWSGFRKRLRHHARDVFVAVEGEETLGEPVRFNIRDGRVESLRILDRTFRRTD